MCTVMAPNSYIAPCQWCRACPRACTLRSWRTCQGLAKMAGERSLKAYFRGNGANVLKNVPETAIKLTCNDRVKALVLGDGRHVSGLSVGGWFPSVCPSQHPCNPPLTVANAAVMVSEGLACQAIHAIIHAIFCSCCCCTCAVLSKPPGSAVAGIRDVHASALSACRGTAGHRRLVRRSSPDSHLSPGSGADAPGSHSPPLQRHPACLQSDIQAGGQGRLLQVTA